MPGNPYTGPVDLIHLGFQTEFGQLVIIGGVRIALQQHCPSLYIAAMHIFNNLRRGQIQFFVRDANREAFLI
ncbi:hypothetical protein D3C81_2180270 [compost metagenome]